MFGIVQVDDEDRVDAGLRAWEARALTHTLTSGFWTLAGAGGPGPSNWRDLHPEGRCSLPLGTFSELLRPLPTPSPQNVPVLPPKPKLAKSSLSNAQGSKTDMHTQCLILGHGSHGITGLGRELVGAYATQPGSQFTSRCPEALLDTPCPFPRAFPGVTWRAGSG